MNRAVVVAVALTGWVEGVASAAAQPALKRLEELIRGRRGTPVAEEGYLGLVVDDRDDRGQGARVIEVLPGGPADRAGLREGDVIVGLDGEPVRSMSDVASALQGAPVGRRFLVDVDRDGTRHRIEATLGTRPPAHERRFKSLPPPPTVPPEGVEEIDQPPAESMPAPPDLAARIEGLEERVAQLERRVAELERLLADRGATKPAPGVPAAEAPVAAPTTVTVVFEGQPVEGATVTFSPQRPGSRAAVGTTDGRGNAAMSTFEAGDGVVPGVYAVGISHGTPPLPKKYGSPATSGLTVQVSGEGTNQLVFELAR